MKTKMIGTLSGVALAAVLGLSNPVSAAVIWDWSYSGGGSLGGSGTFTTTDEQSDGSFLITDITGTSENQTISDLFPPDGFAGNDNLLFSSFPQLTPNGFSYFQPFSFWGLSNLFFDGVQYRLFRSSVEFLSPVVFEATARVTPPTTVPEPSSLFGYIALGGLMLGNTLRKVKQ